MEEGNCEDHIIEGIQTLYEAFAVDIPFQYAGAKDDVDKFQLEYDASDFFTSTHGNALNDEKQQIFVSKAFRRAFRDINRGLQMRKHMTSKGDTNP